eukprot:scaffold10192_cov59-Phaeocystis_antarctica.AAC.7
MVHSFCSVTLGPHARATCSVYARTSMVAISTTSAVQVREPRRWPRTLSCMRWTSTRPTRPSVTQSTTMLSRGHRPCQNAVQPMRARRRAIRKTWQGKAMRKSCAVKATSCEGSAKAPVTGCIAMLTAATVLGASAASTSEHGSGSCSLRGALECRSMAAPRRTESGRCPFYNQLLVLHTKGPKRHQRLLDLFNKATTRRACYKLRVVTFLYHIAEASRRRRVPVAGPV